MEQHPVISNARARGYRGKTTDFFALADFLEKQDSPAVVAAALEECVTARPTAEGLRIRLARLYRAMGHLELALPHLYRVYELNRCHWEAVEFLLWTALECGRPDVASEVKLSFKDGRYDSLVEELQVRVAQQKENTTLKFSLAWLQFEEGQLSASREGFAELVQDPRWGVWSLISLGQCDVGDYPGVAVDHFQRALARMEQEPDDEYIEIYYHLASALARTQEYTQALYACYKLWERYPRYPDLADLMEHLRKKVPGGGRWGDGPHGPAASRWAPLQPRPPLGRLTHHRQFPHSC